MTVQHPGRVGAGLAFLVAVISRGIGLGRPSVLVFDEIFYASDAADLLIRGVEGGNPVHPPLGKWMIAIGIKLIGFEPWGWRLVPLLAGGVLAAATWLLAWRLTRHVGLSVMATVIVLFDGITVVTGRLAMLDGFVALWMLLAIVWLSASIKQGQRMRPRLLVGVALGLAIATKWHAVMLLPVALITTLFIDDALPRREKLMMLVKSVGAMAVVPAAIYVAAHVGFFVNIDESREYFDACEAGDCSTSPVDRVVLFVRSQRDAADFHRTLVPKHPDVASSLTWTTQSEPVKFFDRTCADSSQHPAGDATCPTDEGVAWLISVGNPAVWLIGSIAVLAGAWVSVWRRDGQLLMLVSSALALWIPWVAGSRPGYTFYGVTVVPLFGVILARTLTHTPRLARWWPLPTATVLVFGALFWPIWTAMSIDADFAEWILRLRLDGSGI